MAKVRYCPECGGKVLGRGKYCSFACSLVAVGDAVHQLKIKKGPIYEKWKERLKESLKRL